MTISPIPLTVARWRPLAEKYAAHYCACGHVAHAGRCSLCVCAQFSAILKPEEILAIIQSESFGNPNAVNPSDPSWGLMQVTLFIAREFAGVVDYAQLFDPDTNVKAGAGFLAYLKRRYAKTNPLALADGSVNPAGWVAAYNEGEPNLWKKRTDQAYVAAFVEHLRVLAV